MSTSVNATQGVQGTPHEAVVASSHQPPAPEASESAQASASPQYSSPVIQVDKTTGLALLLVRDTETGDVQSQYPAKQVVAEYGRAMRSSPLDVPSATESSETEASAEVESVDTEQAA